jgi:hypothetical protein
LRLGLSLDGVNPFSMQRSTHSTWPVMVLVYNLPPWLVTKKFFVSLYILISGKESPTSDNIDVYLSPLVEELLELSASVDVFDSLADIRIERPRFKMRDLLLWTISDFPAYGLISGLCTNGYLACPICGPRTISRAARGPKKLKQVFVGSCQWTRRGHPYQFNLQFNGFEEHESAPHWQSAAEILEAASIRERFL